MITDIDPASNAFWIANNMEPKRYEYPLDSASTVVDLGAYTGEFARKLIDKYGCAVICVEPTGAAAAMHNVPGCVVIQAAASTDDTPLKFGGQSYYTSKYEPGEQVFPCFDVLSLLTVPVTLLKINVEGMEYAIMQRILNHGANNHVKYFQIQFHQIGGHETAYDWIAGKLSETHRLMWRVPWVWESWERK
jgi:FkbM family methyltransferase